MARRVTSGRFADQWHTHTGRKAREEEERRRLRQTVAKAKYNMSKGLEASRIEDALAAAEEMMRCGEMPANELLYRMLCIACELPGVERFARVVNCCTSGGLCMQALEWAGVVGRLMERDAPHAQVRVCLNFGVPRGGEVLGLVPVDADRESDVMKVFAGAEHLDLGELSDENDVAEAARRAGRTVDEWARVPKKLVFTIGGVASALAGEYKRCSFVSGDGLRSKRPVFKNKRKESTILAYFFEPSEQDAAPGEETWEAGWYLGDEVGGGGITFAYCPARGNQAMAALVPPEEDTWLVLDGKGGKLEEPGTFTKAPEKAKASDAQVVEWSEAQQLLEQIDLAAVPGRVGMDKDPDAIRYFCHFFILLHLEQLAEVSTFRGRFGFRTGEELARFGIAVVGTKVTSVSMFRQESRRAALPGWPEVGHTHVTFKLNPRSVDRSRFSLKTGESVLVSRGHPLQSRVGEGSVKFADFATQELVVMVHGKWADFEPNAMFRLDSYANRTTFERQLTSLLQFITMQRTKMQEMLIAAGVGKVDLAVLGGDGLVDPGKGTKLGEESGGKEAAGEAPKPRNSSVLTASEVRAMLTSRTAAATPIGTLAEASGAEATAADAAGAGAQEEAAPAEAEAERRAKEGELEGEEGAGSCRREADDAPVGDAEEVELKPDGEEVEVEPDGEEIEVEPEEDPDEDDAVRLARQLAAQFQADEDPEPAAALAAPETRIEPASAEPAVKEKKADDLAKVDTAPGGEPGRSEEVGPKKDPNITEEERIKRATLALANEEAEGIDQERLAEAQEMVAHLSDLSNAQRTAIHNSLSKRLTIVQGPPGTGKTHTSVHILTMWAKQMRYKPLLATSECNIAVDNIADGLARNGVKVVRLGNPTKVREILEGVCLSNMVKMAKMERDKARKMGDESDLEELGEEPEDEEEHEKWKDLQMKWRRRNREERKQESFDRARFIEEAEVICATTTNSGSPQLNGYKFHGILIDEVAQATEPSALVPIITRGAKQIVLCGDHCQLPPSTQSREAELRGMSLSLYSRLVEAGVPFQFLDTQYRAHPALMAFSANCIYQGKLKNGIVGSQRPVPKGVPWPNPECPAAFFECGEPEGLNGESKDNPGESKMVVKLISEVQATGELGYGDIGVVAPYKGQVRTLRQMIADTVPEALENKDLEIASVDNFQGREKELIVFSAVRCNTKASVGFLNDWRRLNVMITRARRGLVVIGSAATLVCDRNWRLWLQFTETQGGCPQGTVAAAVEEAQSNLIAEFGEAGGQRRISRLFDGYDPNAEGVKKAVASIEMGGKKSKRKAAAPEADGWWDEGSAKKNKKEQWWSAKEGSAKRKQAAGKRREEGAEWYEGGDEESWAEEGDEGWWAEDKAPAAKKKKKKAVEDGAAYWAEGLDDEAWDEGTGAALPKAGKARQKASSAKEATEFEGDGLDDAVVFPEDWDEDEPR